MTVSLRTRSTPIHAGFALAALLLFAPTFAAAQQPAAPKDTSGTARPLTPAETAACSRIIGYAFQNPVLLQHFERFKTSGQTKLLESLPDSLRGPIATAVAKGQEDSLKALAKRQLGEETAPKFDEMIKVVVGLPDSVRQSMATLMKNGRSISCTP